MKQTTSLNKGFTLIELLVVITIIAILASIAVPVYNNITLRAEQTKALSNAKQIALGCKVFAIDNNGIYPDVDDQAGSGATDPPGALLADAYGTPRSGSTGNFGALIGGKYTPSETMFWLSKERNGGTRLARPDDDTSTTPIMANNNAWAYVAGLDDSMNPSLPLVATRSGTQGTWMKNDPTVEGGVWRDKVIFVRVDYSGQVAPIDPSTADGAAGPVLLDGGDPFSDSALGWTGAGSSGNFNLLQP